MPRAMLTALMGDAVQGVEADRHEPWCIAVLTADGDVLALRAGQQPVLPAMSVPRGARVVPFMASALADAYNLEAFCLTDLARYCGEPSAPHTMLAETRRQPGTLPAHAQWIAPSRILLGAQQHLSDVIDRCARAGRETERPGFSARLQQWVTSALASNDRTRHLKLDERLTQWNAGHGFSLVRLETSGPAVWFKAVGPPNEAERCVTAQLAARHPRHAAPVIATHDTWAGWLSEEVPGPSLRQRVDSESWTRAARAMACLQIDECARDAQWLESGCVDLRPATLDRNVDEFFGGMEAMFGRQMKAAPRRLLRDELKMTAEALHRALDIAACLPSALVHGDLNPDNALVPENRAVFLDWAGASVGFPLTALENLCGHLRRAPPGDDVASERMVRDAYCDIWRREYGAAVADRALSVAPMLRYAVLAMRSAGWLWHTDTPATREPLLRSLSRSMYHAALAPAH